MTCAERGATGDDRAEGWRAYRADLPAEAEAEDMSTPDVPAVVHYCPICAAREFGDS
jgi:hypothetical protein